MNEIVLLVLSLSLSGSLIALFLILIKPVIKHRLSKTWQYYVFFAVIVRLLLPFSFETNWVGMMFEQAESYIVSEGDPKNITAIPQTRPDEELSMDNAVVQSPRSTSIIPFISKWSWFVWSIPAAILLLRKIIAYWYSMYLVKSRSRKIANQKILAVYDAVCSKMDVKYAPELVCNMQVTTPMLVGILHPVIVLPDMNCNECDLYYIFQHELTHYRRFDIGYKWMVQIAVCIHWFNPLIHWISREIDRNCELSCDESVLRRLGNKEQRAYGDMLLKMISPRQSCKSAVMSISLSKDAKLMKERLGAIMKYQKKSKTIIVVSIMLGTFILCGAAFTGGYYWGKSSDVPTKNESILTGITEPNSSQPSSEQNFVHEQVEMRKYEGDDGHPYIHETSMNNTDKVITGYQQGILAFDENGNPLEIDWWSLDTEYEPSYYYLISIDSANIAPGQKYDELGGFSLDIMGIDPEVEKISYVLYCIKEITFEDGSTWSNPDYDKWLDDYHGKTVAKDILENYYPRSQPI